MVAYVEVSRLDKANLKDRQADRQRQVLRGCASNNGMCAVDGLDQGKSEICQIIIVYWALGNTSFYFMSFL